MTASGPSFIKTPAFWPVIVPLKSLFTSQNAFVLINGGPEIWSAEPFPFFPFSFDFHWIISVFPFFVFFLKLLLGDCLDESSSSMMKARSTAVYFVCVKNSKREKKNG